MASWIVAGAILLIISTVLGVIAHFTSHSVVTVYVGGQSVSAKVAKTWSEQEKGLSGTTQLATNQGMLFEFPRSGRWSFWMRDMNYPIDIIWINSDKSIVYEVQNISPDTYPKTFTSPVDAQYALELTAGFVARNHVGVGTLVAFGQ